MTERMAANNFEVNDGVRFIGTDIIYFVTKCNKKNREFQIQRGNDRANRQWVTEIYLELVELVEPARTWPCVPLWRTSRAHG
jgi:hypothetical protein